jgi:hypothetical protein
LILFRLLARVFAVPPSRTRHDLSQSHIKRVAACGAAKGLHPHFADLALITIDFATFERGFFAVSHVHQVLPGTAGVRLSPLGRVDSSQVYALLHVPRQNSQGVTARNIDNLAGDCLSVRGRQP